MRIAITLVLILVAAGVGGVLAFGHFVSGDQLRAQLVEQAEATSGRTVLIDGRMDLGLLPRPTVSVGQTRFLGAEPGAQPVLEVDRIDFAIAPLALLRGELQVEEIRLVRPRVRMTEPDQPPVGLLQLLAAKTAIDLPRGLDRLTVIDGEVVIGAVAQSALIVERIDLEIEAEADLGPFFVSGSFVRGGEPFLFDGRLGRLTADPNTTSSFALRTAPEAKEQVAAAFQGIVSLDQLDAFRGEASVAGSRLDVALELLGPASLIDRSVPLAAPFAIDGLVESRDGRGEVTDVDVKLGSVQGRGRLEFALMPARRVEIELEIPRVDTAEMGFEPELFRALAGLGRIGHGEIDLSVTTLVHAGAAVRDVRAKLGLQPNGDILLRQSHAVLPGETDLLLEGRIVTGDEPGFLGRLSAVTDRLGEMLAWLDPSISDEAADRFRTLIVEAEVAAGPRQIELRQLDGRLDASKIAGDLSLVPGERPEVKADLDIDRLSVERYLPEPGHEAAGAILLDRLRSTDLVLELDLERLNAAGLRWSDVHFSGSARQGRIEVEELRAGLLADTSLRISGDVDLAEEAADLALVLRSAKPGPLIRRFGQNPAFSLERLGELEIEGSLSGWTAGAEVDVQARLGRLRSSGRGSAGIDGAAGLTMDLDVDVVHPHYGELLKNLSLSEPATSGEPLAGAFKLRRQADGTAGVVGHVALGASRVTGQIDYATDAERPRLDARLSVAQPELDALVPLLALAGYRLDALSLARPLPGAWPSLYLDASPLRALDGRIELSGKDASGEIGFEALVTSDAGLLRLERSRLSLGKDAGELALEATLDVREPTPALALVLEASGLPLDRLPADDGWAAVLAGRVDLYGQLRGTGWSLADLVRSSEGDLAVSIKDGEITRQRQDGQPAAVSLDLLEAQLDVERGLGELTRLDVETADGAFVGRGLVDLLIWMVDLEVEKRGGDRRIEIVGPPGDLQVRVHDPSAPPPDRVNQPLPDPD